MFPWNGEPSDFPAVDAWLRHSEEIWDAAHVKLQQAIRRQWISADRRRQAALSFQPGQMVWFSRFQASSSL